MARSCATRSRNSQKRNGGSSPPTSPTSTVRSSRWSTSRRRSREPSSPATPATPGPSVASISMSSPPTCRRAAAPSRARRRARCRALRARLHGRYGDDSIAQVGGAHIACEWVSNVLTKVLQRGRLAAYLEQSTRYIPYDQPLPESAGGGHRFYRDDRARTGVRRRHGGACSRPTRARSSRSGNGRPSGGHEAMSPSRPPGALDPGEGPRPAPRAAARRDPVPRRHLRLGARPMSG